MGKVYLAEVTGHAPGIEDGVKVALKVIHPHLLETPGFFKRFLRDPEIGKSVEQDNVVRCFDCDALLVDGHQQHYLAMEYVEGQIHEDGVCRGPPRGGAHAGGGVRFNLPRRPAPRRRRRGGAGLWRRNRVTQATRRADRDPSDGRGRRPGTPHRGRAAGARPPDGGRPPPDAQGGPREGHCAPPRRRWPPPGPAIREAAASLVLLHQHPSHNPEPSPEDVEITRRLVAVGELVGIRIADHVVLGGGRYVSFLERGLVL